MIIIIILVMIILLVVEDPHLVELPSGLLDVLIVCNMIVFEQILGIITTVSGVFCSLLYRIVVALQLVHVLQGYLEEVPFLRALHYCLRGMQQVLTKP